MQSGQTAVDFACLLNARCVFDFCRFRRFQIVPNSGIAGVFHSGRSAFALQSRIAVRLYDRGIRLPRSPIPVYPCAAFMQRNQFRVQ